MPDPAGKVFLVGAGPGPSDLITIRGAKALRSAEVVVYDYLVSEELLGLAPPGVEMISVAKRDGSKTRLAQNQINSILIERASAGKRVVRLKGGDPFIFGRGGEEAAALAAAGIVFEVIPGITSAIAAPAFAGIPLTHRDHGSFVAFVTGHEDESKGAQAVPWAELARAARQRGTLVLLMATGNLDSHLQRLIAEGMPPQTPAAVIQWAATAAQRTILATLDSLAERVSRAGIVSPATTVIGACAALREELQWFEHRPLFGRRIVVTRGRRGADPLCLKLRELGAEVIEFPTIETLPPESFETLDSAIGRLGSFDWIVFTSAQGVESFIARLRALRRDVREIGKASIAAIGPATAAALERYALGVSLVPDEYRAEAIADALGEGRIRGRRFLIPRAQTAREALPELLGLRGAAEVVTAPAYQTVAPSSRHALRIRDRIDSATIDLVSFTSSSTAANFRAMVDESAKSVKAAAIGPITAETARAAGFEVVAVASVYTLDGLTEAIVNYFASCK
ncbi:MAG TPA: uroporphyrinogen-III C-methyltransferase [Candidatus Binataceae bacterium]